MLGKPLVRNVRLDDLITESVESITGFLNVEESAVRSSMARPNETSKSARDACPMNLSPGSKLGPYETIDLIGSGGMGEV
jgi:hypothetical protein